MWFKPFCLSKMLWLEFSQWKHCRFRGSGWYYCCTIHWRTRYTTDNENVSYWRYFYCRFWSTNYKFCKWYFKIFRISKTDSFSNYSWSKCIKNGKFGILINYIRKSRNIKNWIPAETLLFVENHMLLKKGHY